LFLLNALSLLVPIFYLVVCISIMDDVAQITIVLITSSAGLLWWSETAGRVPMGTLLMAKLVASDSIITVLD
jgi:hypothetical protein